ncbi:MAG: hypothetical protein QNJ67_08505 [Kiloniellales bacterium]|nr:hypothetical protein [Kiloniellales bacterium]
MTEENVTVNADSYMDKQRQNVFFRASFPGESVLAVHLSIENQRKAPVRIDPSAVTVVLPDGNSLRPKESKILVDFLGIAPEPPPLFSMEALADAFSMPVRSSPLLLPRDNPYAIPVAQSREHQWRIRRWILAKYEGMQLKGQVIGPGGTASGFVYFIDTEARDQFKPALLRLPMAEEHRSDGTDLVIPNIGAAGGHSIPFNRSPRDLDSGPSRGTAAVVLLGPGDVAPAAATGKEPLYQPWQVRGYLLRHKVRFKTVMADYNQQHRIVVDERGETRLAAIYRTKIKETRGDRVVLGVGLVVGVGVNETSDEVDIEFEWRDNHLVAVGPAGG